MYVKIDDIGEEAYQNLSKWDIGDLAEVKGIVFRTRRGEVSVHAKAIRLLAKSLLPLPEKYHGLQDTDLRYRQRYVDLIMNPEVKDTFIKRSEIIRTIRRFSTTRALSKWKPLSSTPSPAALRQGRSSPTTIP